MTTPPPASNSVNSAVSNRVWTVPNALSMLRLALLPLFCWLVLRDHWLVAFVVLAIGSVTDYLDGKIARSTGQITRLGQLLDPLADRLYMVCTVVVLGITGVIGWWLVVLLGARELFIAAMGIPLKMNRLPIPPVHFIGKAATFNLMYGFPLLILGEVGGGVGQVARVFGWAFVLWGTALYWVAGVMYALQIGGMVRQARARVAAGV